MVAVGRIGKHGSKTPAQESRVDVYKRQIQTRINGYLVPSSWEGKEDSLDCKESWMTEQPQILFDVVPSSLWLDGAVGTA